MSENNRTLTISLIARTDMFNAGMNKARKTLGQFRKDYGGVAKDVLRHSRNIGIAAAGIATGVAAAGAAIFHTSRNSIDELAKMAQRIGATTQEMQVLQRIAELDGIGIEAMNSNMMRMTKTLGEASLGIGGAGKVLEQFGLNAAELVRMPISEQFATIAEAISRIPNQAERAALATAVFGRSGVAMLVSLQKGRAVIDDMFAEMEGTGELFSAEDAAVVEEMNDAMTRLWGVVAAFGNQMTIQLAPAVTHIIELIQDWVMSAGGAGEIMTMVIDDYVIPAFDSLITKIDGAIVAANAFSAVWLTVKGAVLSVLATLAAGFEFNLRVIKAVTLTIAGVFMSMVKTIANGINSMIETANKIGGKVGLQFGTIDTSGISAKADELAQASKAASEKLLNTSVFDDPFIASLTKDATDANQAAVDAWKKFRDTTSSEAGTAIKRNLQSLRDALQRPMEGTAGIQQAAMSIDGALSTIEDSVSDIPSLAENSADAKDEAEKKSRDTGQFKVVKAAEFAQRIGGVTGGISQANDSLASRTASMVNDKRTGADTTNSLLSGILQAAQQTAMNTGRGMVAVAG